MLGNGETKKELENHSAFQTCCFRALVKGLAFRVSDKPFPIRLTVYLNACFCVCYERLVGQRGLHAQNSHPDILQLCWPSGDRSFAQNVSERFYQSVRNDDLPRFACSLRTMVQM